ncbi:hypothetical protein [Halorubellus salinus]|uniref:hypothetical protein n=1 Tax=Halorubellus salinus TaxID=755309 RepID=UPI001D08386D|nr:hypothetical protein [Halorubellus salinus]
MPVLEARARILGGLAVALAALTFAVATLAGTDVFVGVPNVGAFVCVVALPGFLLGRTGVPERLGPVLYELVVAYVTAGIVAVGILVTGTYVLATAGGLPTALVAFVATLASSWAPWGPAGYVLGLASTLVE